MRRIFYAILLMVVLLPLPRAAEGRTLVVYYSFTNDTRTIVGQLTDQMEADVYEVQPAEEGLDYAANNYAIGSRLIAAIREAPEQASSYPSIKQNKVDLSQYDNIIIATPLWWSNMAAPMQTFLFEHGREMAGKHVALIVSSQSSGISSVVADARRLVPDAVWAGDALWINRSNRSRTTSLLAEWLKEQTFAPDQMAENIVILVGNTAFPVTLEQNAAAEAFVALLPLTVEMNELNSNEKYYYLSESLPRNSNNPGTIHSGDLMLWGSDCLVLFYETFQTAYSYTPLGRVDNPAGLKEALGRGNVSVTFMKANTGIHTVKRLPAPAEPCYTVGGLRATGATKGIVIRNGKKYNKK